MEIRRVLLITIKNRAHELLSVKEGDPGEIVHSQGITVKMQNGWFAGVLQISERIRIALIRGEHKGEILTPLDSEFLNMCKKIKEINEDRGLGVKRLRNVRESDKILRFYIDYANQKLHKAAA